MAAEQIIGDKLRRSLFMSTLNEEQNQDGLSSSSVNFIQTIINEDLKENKNTADLISQAI